ncbi:LecA/PA-IL family lectin [Inquilinus sp. NPDC058860]|uniref:LecA/PA-IL family lectin n=1 Tax=Inquilinus sp. NPDC058860 TaxID=3346652 RepID=UPI0036973103
MPDALKKVDLVVLIDTSASMKDEAEALSKGMVTAIEDAKKACPSDLRVQFLGIEGTFASTEFTKTARQHLTGIGVDAGQLAARAHGGAKDSSAQEQIAQTVVDVSRHFDWRAGAERALFVLGDESLDGGGLTIGAKAVKLTDRAIAAAVDNEVKVHAYQTTLPAQPTPEQAAALTAEYKRLALRTGGEYYINTQGLADFGKVLQDAICASQVPVEETIKDKEKEADEIEGGAASGPAGGGDKPAARPAPWTGRLDAKNEAGIKTGVTVKKGDLLTIVASGWARSGNVNMQDYPWHGPQGDKNWRFQAQSEANFLLPLTLGALLIQIGSSLHYIGTGAIDWEAPADGEVVFRFNDRPSVYHENDGAYDIAMRYEAA